MAEDALVESLVADSLKLVEALDGQDNTPSNVLWYFFPDAEQWCLLVAGQTFDRLLPRDGAKAYQVLARSIAAAKLNSLTIADVKLVRTDDAVLVGTKSAIKTPPDRVVRAHFRESTFNGVYVKEMVVLRAA